MEPGPSLQRAGAGGTNSKFRCGLNSDDLKGKEFKS